MQDFNLTLAKLIKSKLNDKPLLVAIDGTDGVGKTYFAKALVRELKKIKVEAFNVSIDSFHHPRSVRYQKGEFSAEGYFYDSFNYEKFIKHVIEPTKDLSNLVLFPNAFEHYSDREALQKGLKISACSVLIVDGVFLQRSELNAFWDYSICLTGDDSIILSRAIQRDAKNNIDVQVLKDKYTKRYQAGQALYISLVNPSESADLVIDNTDFQNPIISKGTITKE